MVNDFIGHFWCAWSNVDPAVHVSFQMECNNDWQRSKSHRYLSQLEYITNI